MLKLSKHRQDQLEKTVRRLRNMPDILVRHTNLIRKINQRLRPIREAQVIDNSAMSASRGY